MTIGFLINTCEPFYRGGYERRVWAFARELVRQGNEVRVYTSCPRDEVIDGVHFVRLGAPRVFFNQKGVRNLWADLFFTFNIFRLLWKLRIRELDVLDVCATPFVHLPVVKFIAWWKRLPLVLTCHEALLADLPAYVRERGHQTHFSTWGFTRILATLYRVGTGLVSRRIAVSERTAAALSREGFAVAAVVEFGLEAEAFSVSPPAARPGSEGIRFIFCGRLTPIKSVDETVAALLSLRTKDRLIYFDILGEGSERPKLEKMISEANAQSQITLHGEVSEAEKRDLLAKSDVFVLSSPREGFSIATLEGMAQGCCAVVVSDLECRNGALDFVEHEQQGLCVQPGEGLLAQALERLMQDPALRLRLRQSAWQAAQKYRIERQAKRLVEVYQSEP